MTSNTQEILTQGELLANEILSDNINSITINHNQYLIEWYSSELLASLNDSEETLEDNQLDIEEEALLLTQAYNNNKIGFTAKEIKEAINNNGKWKISNYDNIEIFTKVLFNI